MRKLGCGCLIVVIGGFILLVILGTIMNEFIDDENDGDENNIEKVEEDIDPIEENEVDKDENESNENEEESQVVEFDEELKFNQMIIERVVAGIEDNELKLSFSWINGSKEKSPFTAMNSIWLRQGDEELKEISGAFEPDNNREVYFKNASGGSHRVNLVYELIDDSEVEITFSSTLVDKKEQLYIELE